MKILIIHNKYGKFSGEEAVVDAQINLLKENGHKVITYYRSSEELDEMKLGKAKAFFSALYNPKSIEELKILISHEQPDIVHIHNLYPFISPAILPMIKKLGTPIVMTVHNYRLVCPNGLFFNKGAICEKCTGASKELNCIINNCEGSLLKSTGYALRNFWARTHNQYLNNVDLFLSLSTVQNNKLIANGFKKEQCLIIPNSYGGSFVKEVSYNEGYYIGYVGRISPEKGSEIIIELAKKLPDINFKIAGNPINEKKDFPRLKNVEFVGFLNKEKLALFYSNCLFTLFTSVWNETFGLSIIEAFAHKKPVIASDLGASPEIVENNKSGLIYKNNDLADLTKKVNQLYSDKDRIREMGLSGFKKVEELYSAKVYYKKLFQAYQSVLEKR